MTVSWFKSQHLTHFILSTTHAPFTSAHCCGGIECRGNVLIFFFLFFLALTRCAADPTVQFYTPVHKKEFRFSLEAFKFIGQHDQVSTRSQSKIWACDFSKCLKGQFEILEKTLIYFLFFLLSQMRRSTLLSCLNGKLEGRTCKGVPGDFLAIHSHLQEFYTFKLFLFWGLNEWDVTSQLVSFTDAAMWIC